MKKYQQVADVLLLGLLSALVGESFIAILPVHAPIHLSTVFGVVFLIGSVVVILQVTHIVQQFTILSSVVAEGNSMLPTFPSGLVFSFAYETDEIRVGDIIVFEMASRTIVHRVIEHRGSKVITKGDNNEEIDGRIPLDNVKGKVITIRGQPLYIPLSQKSRFETLTNFATRIATNFRN